MVSTWVSPFAEFLPRLVSSVFSFFSIPSLTTYGKRKRIIKTMNFRLFRTQVEQFHIQSGLLLTSISRHSFCSFQQSQGQTVYLPKFGVVCLNCWEGTRPKIVCHQPRWCWLFLPGKSSKHLGKILPSKVQRVDLRTVHRFPIGPSVKHKVDPFLSSSNAFWMFISKKTEFYAGQFHCQGLLFCCSHTLHIYQA